jgi:hypothetical protein
MAKVKPATGGRKVPKGYQGSRSKTGGKVAAVPVFKKNSRDKSDKEVQEYWEATRPTKSPLRKVKLPGGKTVAYSYDHAVLRSDGEFEEVPDEGAPESEWEGLVLAVPEELRGGQNAFALPLWSMDLPDPGFEDLGPDEKLRCVRDVRRDTWVYCPRSHVHGETESRGPALYRYIGNSVPGAANGGSSNCRIVLDPEWLDGVDDVAHRCLLVTTKKLEKGQEWRYDVEFASRKLLDHMGFSDDESEPGSVPEVLPPPTHVTRSKTAAEIHSYEDRMITVQESQAVYLSSIVDCMREASRSTEILGERQLEFMHQLSEFMDRVIQHVDGLHHRVGESGRSVTASGVPTGSHRDGEETKEEL